MSNSIAVVTGAGSGIGAAIAKELAKRGNFVVVTDLNLASAKKVADEIGNADAIELDVTNPSDVDKIIDQIINKHKKIDIWVSNAGISKMQKFVDISPKEGVCFLPPIPVKTVTFLEEFAGAVVK